MLGSASLAVGIVVSNTTLGPDYMGALTVSLCMCTSLADERPEEDGNDGSYLQRLQLCSYALPAVLMYSDHACRLSSWDSMPINSIIASAFGGVAVKPQVGLWLDLTIAE